MGRSGPRNKKGNLLRAIEKNEQEMLDRNIHPLYYYIYDEMEDQRIATVCLAIDLNEEIVLARGVAVCSLLDVFNRRVGRSCAAGRVLKTLEYEDDTGYIRSDFRVPFYGLFAFGREIDSETYFGRLLGVAAELDIGAKGTWRPILTEHEEFLVDRKIKALKKRKMEKAGIA